MAVLNKILYQVILTNGAGQQDYCCLEGKSDVKQWFVLDCFLFLETMVLECSHRDKKMNCESNESFSNMNRIDCKFKIFPEFEEIKLLPQVNNLIKPWNLVVKIIYLN